MSKHQKGKKHRTVNRRPRPVGSPRNPGASREAVRPARVAAPQDEPSGGEASRLEPSWSEAEALFQVTVRDGGLGQNAGRTWRQLLAAGDRGSTLGDLSAAVGYQPDTVRRHLKGLADRGMVREDGQVWCRTPSGAAEPVGAPLATGAALVAR
jgi:DNA-binding transcriptional ArsR family regulator